MVKPITIILLSLWENSAVTSNCPTGWPKGLTEFKANVILQNTFAVQMALVQHILGLPINDMF